MASDSPTGSTSRDLIREFVRAPRRRPSGIDVKASNSGDQTFSHRHQGIQRRGAAARVFERNDTIIRGSTDADHTAGSRSCKNARTNSFPSTNEPTMGLQIEPKLVPLPHGSVAASSSSAPTISHPPHEQTRASPLRPTKRTLSCRSVAWRGGTRPCRGGARGRRSERTQGAEPVAQRDPAPHPWEPERLSGASPQTRMGPGWSRAAAAIVGLDVSKAWLDGYLARSGRRLRVGNDAAGHRRSWCSALGDQPAAWW